MPESVGLSVDTIRAIARLVLKELSEEPDLVGTDATLRLYGAQDACALLGIREAFFYECLKGRVAGASPCPLEWKGHRVGRKKLYTYQTIAAFRDWLAARDGVAFG